MHFSYSICNGGSLGGLQEGIQQIPVGSPVEVAGATPLRTSHGTKYLEVGTTQFVLLSEAD